MGDSAKWLDADLVGHAAEAVLHYFKSEKGQNTVSVGEFSEALERVLRGLGLDVKAAGKDTPSFKTGDSSPMTPPRVVEADLRLLAGDAETGLSDPYVLLQMSGQQDWRTKVMPRTLNPFWNWCHFN